METTGNDRDTLIILGAIVRGGGTSGNGLESQRWLMLRGRNKCCCIKEAPVSGRATAALKGHTRGRSSSETAGSTWTTGQHLD